MVGSAEQSGGGVASVIKQMKQMAIWKKYACYWLGTQIQRGIWLKLGYALKSYLIASFRIWRYHIIHFHTVPDRICLIVQLPVLLLALVGKKKIIMHVHMGNQLAHHTNNFLFKWCLNKADRIVLLAKKWEALFKSQYPNVNTPIVVIYNTCEKGQHVDECTKDNVIIMAAYMNENKAPDVLLKAWKKIHQRYQNWRVVMMGNGRVDYYREMAYEMGLDGSVDFTGYLSGSAKEEIWNKASIYVMCSYNEGFPMVVLEAWARGVAVVTTPVGGLPDVIVDNENCLVFPFGDSTSLADRLEALMRSPAKRHKLTQNGVKLFNNVFSQVSISDQWDALYQMVMNE